MGGYYSYFFTDFDGMKGVLEKGEISIQVSGNVACLLLEKVRDVYSDMKHQIGF